MLVFVLLVLCSLLAGVSITYLFKLNLFFSERILYGTVISLSTFVQIIYLFTFNFGFKPLNIFFVLAAIICSTIYLSWELFKRRKIIKEDISNIFLDYASNKDVPDSENRFRILDKLHLPIIMIFWLIIFIVVFHKNLYVTPEGIFSNAPTDISVHLSLITSFVWGDNFPAMTPLHAGTKLLYPFLSDYFSAFLIACGMNAIYALSFPAIFLCTIFTGIIYYFTFHLTNSKFAAALSPFLLYLGGGFGFFKFFETDLPEHGYNFIRTMNEATNLYSDLDKYNFNFFNFIIGYLIPQRSFLFGFPIALTILILLWLGIQRKKKEEFLLAGLLGGIFPLFHYHSFMSVSLISGFFFLLYFSKDRSYIKKWLYFFIPLIILSIPQIIFVMTRISGNSLVFKPYYGWMTHDNNYFWFWIKNTGFFMVLILDTLLNRDINRNLKKLYIPFVFLFLISNLFSFSLCWIGDNAKIIFYWFIGSIPFAAISLVHLYKKHKLITGVIFLTLTLSGILDITKSVITDKRTFMIWSKDAVNIAKAIREKTAPRSVFFNAPIHYSPIFLTGRATLMGDPMHVCTQGISMDREKDIKVIFESENSKLKIMLLKQLAADYALIGPPEKEKLKDKTFFEKNFPVFIAQGDYKVFKLK